MEPFHTLDISGLTRPLLEGAVSGAIFQLNYLETDFSIKVYNSQLVEIDGVQSFRERLLHCGDSIELSEQDMMLIYTCHYVAGAFANDKEAFFKWFLMFDNQARGVDDSEDYRVVTGGAQRDMVRIIEDSYLWTEGMQRQKERLERALGMLA